MHTTCMSLEPERAGVLIACLASTTHVSAIAKANFSMTLRGTWLALHKLKGHTSSPVHTGTPQQVRLAWQTSTAGGRLGLCLACCHGFGVHNLASGVLDLACSWDLPIIVHLLHCLLAKYEPVCLEVHLGDGLHISQQTSEHTSHLFSLILPADHDWQSIVQTCTDRNRMDAVLTDPEGNICQCRVQSTHED